MYGDIGDELAELTKAVQASNRANTPWRSFGHGVLVGLGSTIGAAIAIAVAIFLLRNLIEIPYLGPIGRLLPKLEQALEQPPGTRSNAPSVVPGSNPSGRESSESEAR